jgi:DNA-binding protein YbaB
MFDGLADKEQEIKKELTAIEIVTNLEGIVLKGNGAGELLDLTIPQQLIETGDKEMIEDLLLTSITKFNNQVAEESAKVSQKMLNDMLGGGLGNLFG